MAADSHEGRPTKYKPVYADIARKAIAEAGFSIPKLAKLFSVSNATIYNWMDREEKFLVGVRHGRKTYEGIKIHRALAKRATGYRYTETTEEVNPLTKKVTVTKRVKKSMPPSVNAIKHWQANMDPEYWKDRKTVDGNLVLSQAIKELEDEGRPTPEET